MKRLLLSSFLCTLPLTGLAQGLTPELRARLHAIQRLLGVPLSADRYHVNLFAPTRFKGGTHPESVSIYAYRREDRHRIYNLRLRGRARELGGFTDYRTLLRPSAGSGKGKISDRKAVEIGRRIAARFGLTGLSVQDLRRHLWNDGSPSRGAVIELRLIEAPEGLWATAGRGVSMALDERDGRPVNLSIVYRSAYDSRPVRITKERAIEIVRRLAAPEGYTGKVQVNRLLWWHSKRRDERGVSIQVKAYDMAAIKPSGLGHKRYWLNANTGEVLSTAVMPPPLRRKPQTRAIPPRQARPRFVPSQPIRYVGPGRIERAPSPPRETPSSSSPVWPWILGGLGLTVLAGGTLAVRMRR